MRTIVAGGRGFDNVDRLYYTLDHLTWELTSIVSGRAKGADQLGEMYADEKNIPLSLFPANWDRDGKAAGPLRNIEMAKNADALVAFWDGKSRGTKHMIDTAKKYNLKVLVINY